ncbi:MAG: LytTR family transcriptional regulator [Pedobacter sp.]|nr:MAG: LytTR family transcriptional regulator [Pedobacter sp.]
MIHISRSLPLPRPELVIRLESDASYTNIYYKNQPRPVLMSRTLLHFQRGLPSFWRVSKSALVNPAYVVGIVREDKKYYVRMTDDTLVLIARRRQEETLAALKAISQSD